MFAPTHTSLSPALLRVVEALLMDAPSEHAIHYTRGLEQIRAYMRSRHAGPDGAPLPFRDMVLKWSAEWAEHVEKAIASPIAMATERPMLPFLEGLVGIDIRVAARGRPDDAIYNGDEYARKYYPRGNYVAKWALDAATTAYFPLVRAYPKFTGHEDDGELSAGDTTQAAASIASEALSKYFTKPATETESVISTVKENGEAAHLAVLKKADGSFVYLVGSKNVHMAISTTSDIEKAIAVGSPNGQNPFAGARPVAYGLLRMLEGLSPAKRSIFCEFLWQTRLTASFELLCPNHQHVELLAVPDDTPVLFGFSFPTLGSQDGVEICMNPLLGYALARYCGVRTVQFDVVPYTGAEFKAVLSAIKTGYQTEGKVNLYVDGSVCARSARRPSRSWSRCWAKEEMTPDEALALTHKQLEKRFVAITNWLQLADADAQAYCDLGKAFVTYVASVRLASCDGNASAQKTVQHDVTDLFPVVWKEFLEATDRSDRINCA
ncbi:hypothetical protein SPRG_15365 [Saprolegnia parasitica CBS 223.65]|uniref:Uncharacterized protein n=1 Tax=Saprolegnia parasitica (strain CBS 223.65) TaxID=695850 RepID=A0A067BRN3_SAPPC|nr:hypothetical protein SPRG_15365 [Saprolegnia parasitica CBS 223.65]KDO19460.1 hypothetical protein SPRG_15365 [Saprolegnia parasitica CBS 223.65]|eukprot:XP_012209843.1 hypothetical protein SPRG_15365 [Saprolegnia parasitica CBS 223.65]